MASMMTFQYQDSGYDIDSAWNTDEDTFWIIVNDKLGLPMSAEICIANALSTKESTYSSNTFQRVRIIENNTAKILFYGKIISTEPMLDDQFGQILIIRARDNFHELNSRINDKDYTTSAGYTFTTRSALIKQIVADHSYSDGTIINIDTTDSTRFANSTKTEASGVLSIDYSKTVQSALSTIFQLAQEDPQENTVVNNFGYDYYLEPVFNGNIPTPKMNYFKRASKPTYGQGLTIEYGLATDTNQVKAMFPDYSFKTSGKEIITKVRLEYETSNGEPKTKIVHLLDTSNHNGTFQVGESLTGAAAGIPSGTTIEYVGDGFLIVTWKSNILTTNQTIQGATSNATATLDAVPRQTLGQDNEKVLTKYHVTSETEAQAIVAEVLKKEGASIIRGDFSIDKWPYFYYNGAYTLIRTGNSIRIKNSYVSSVNNTDMVVTEISYNESPGSFGSKIKVVGAFQGRSILVDPLQHTLNIAQEGQAQAPSAIGGIPSNSQFLQFDSVVNLRAPSTTLTNNITAVATTIAVSSTAEFPSSGTIFIDAERIVYTGKTGVSFTGCSRGYNSLTTAAAHSSGASVDSPDQIIWNSTTARFSDGSTQTLTSPSTGNSVSLATNANDIHWIYITKGSSNIGVTNSYTSALGSSIHIFATAKCNYTTGKTDVVVVGITGPQLTASTIMTNQLSAFSADLGKITAGAIKLPSTAKKFIDNSEIVPSGNFTGFTGFTLDGDHIAGYNGGNLQTELRSSDGKFYGGGGAVTISSTGISIDNSVNSGSEAASGYIRFTGATSVLKPIGSDCAITRTGNDLNITVGNSAASLYIVRALSVVAKFHSNALYIDGIYALSSGDLYFGSTSGTTILRLSTFGGNSATFTASALPSADNTYNLGQLGNGGLNRYVWKELYSNSVYTTNVYSSQAISDDISINLSDTKWFNIKENEQTTLRLGEGIEFPYYSTIPVSLYGIGRDAAALVVQVAPGASLKFKSGYGVLVSGSYLESMNISGTSITLNGINSLIFQNSYSTSYPTPSTYYMHIDSSSDLYINTPTAENFIVSHGGVISFYAQGGGFYSRVPYQADTDHYTPSGSSWYILRDSGVSSGDMVFNVANSKLHRFRVNGQTIATLNSSILDLGTWGTKLRPGTTNAPEIDGGGDVFVRPSGWWSIDISGATRKVPYWD